MAPTVHGRYWLLALLILLATLLVRPMALLLTEPRDALRVVDYVVDDGYYYLGIAANLAEHGRSTLDGVTPTNGYQPLWLLTLAALAAIVGTDTWTLFVATVCLVAVIAAAGVTVALFWRRTPSAPVANVAAASLAITILAYPTVFLTGMEPVIALLAFVPLLVLIERAPDRRPLPALGAVLALMFLTRLDGLAVSGSVAALVACERGSGRPLSTRLAQLAGVVVPVAAAYFLINQWQFDSAVPVSGLAKQVGAPYFANWGTLRYALGLQRPLQVLTAFWLLLELLAWRRGCWTPTFRKSLLVLVAAAAAQSLYYAALSGWHTWPWYIWLSALSFAALIARVMHLAMQLLERRQALLLAVPVLIALLAMEADKARSHLRGPIADLRMALDHAAPTLPDSALSFNQLSLRMLDDPPWTPAVPGARVQVAMGDRAGGLAYWGRRQLSLAQAEGLTLDKTYIEARRAGTAEAWFEARYTLDDWIVDRGAVPTVTDAAGGTAYVVADPIQGRVTLDLPPTFCFPAAALRAQRQYGVPPVGGTRYVFDFRRRQPCSPAARALIAEAASGSGLRRLSLPADYADGARGAALTADEDRDRRIARHRHAAAAR